MFLFHNLDSDFWFTFCDDPYTKYLILPVSIFSIVFLFPLYLIIFMHIQDKGFRTVLTYGENIVYLYGFIYFYIPFTLDVIRLFSGPLAQNLCWFTIFSKNFAAIGAQFGFVICIIIRVSLLTLHFLIPDHQICSDHFSTYSLLCINQWPFAKMIFLDFSYTCCLSFFALLYLTLTWLCLAKWA